MELRGGSRAVSPQTALCADRLDAAPHPLHGKQQTIGSSLHCLAFSGAAIRCWFNFRGSGDRRGGLTVVPAN